MSEHFIKTAAIILAAGKASRFGKPKQLLKLHNQTLIERSIRHAQEAGCEPIILVTGAYHEEISQLNLPSSATLSYHAKWQEGMGSSIAYGVSQINKNHYDWEAMYIMLADQPAVTANTLLRLKSSFDPPEITIALCQNAENQGPPALFCRSHLPALSLLQNDEGAKSVVKANTDQLAMVQAPETAWDIDTQSTWDLFNKNQPH